jgi:hypothetical protein
VLIEKPSEAGMRRPVGMGASLVSVAACFEYRSRAGSGK